MTNDKCRVEVVDGEAIRVHGSEPMNEKDREMLADVVRAAKQMMRDKEARKGDVK